MVTFSDAPCPKCYINYAASFGDKTKWNNFQMWNNANDIDASKITNDQKVVAHIQNQSPPHYYTIEGTLILPTSLFPPVINPQRRQFDIAPAPVTFKIFFLHFTFYIYFDSKSTFKIKGILDTPKQAVLQRTAFVHATFERENKRILGAVQILREIDGGVQPDVPALQCYAAIYRSNRCR